MTINFADEVVKAFSEKGSNNQWAVTPQGREKIMGVVHDAENLAKQYAKYKAEEIAAVATQLMFESIDQGALNVLSGAGGIAAGEKNPFEQGVFAMEEIKDIDLSIANGYPVVSAGRKTKFAPENPGRWGTFFEVFFYGLMAKGNTESPLPDLSTLAKKYGEVIEYLAPELKTSRSGGISVGTKTIPYQKAELVPGKGFEMGGESYKATPYKEIDPTTKRKIYDVDPKTGRQKKSYKWSKGETIEKFSVKLKTTIDDFVVLAVAVVKILQKMAALMVIETQSEIGGSSGRYKLFSYKSATIFSQLNVDLIMKAMDIKPVNKLFSYRVETIDSPKLTREQIESGDYAGQQWYAPVGKISVSIGDSPSLIYSGKGSADSLYGDSYPIWENEISRNIFFENMYKINRARGVFAVAHRGTQQYDYNRMLKNAVYQMKKWQGKR